MQSAPNQYTFPLWTVLSPFKRDFPCSLQEFQSKPSANKNIKKKATKSKGRNLYSRQRFSKTAPTIASDKGATFPETNKRLSKQKLFFHLTNHDQKGNIKLQEAILNQSEQEQNK